MRKQSLEIKTTRPSVDSPRRAIEMSLVANASSIVIWIDKLRSTPQERYMGRSIDCARLTCSPPAPIIPSDDKESPQPVRKRRMEAEETPRPIKRRRDINVDADAPDFSAPPSARAESEAESHHSGRLSPAKQLMHLEDCVDQPIVFCNFDDDVQGEEPADVRSMRTMIQRYADGVGVLGYHDSVEVAQSLPALDKTRFQYPWANDPDRLVYGSMPDPGDVADLVRIARLKDRGTAEAEDVWNTEVHLPLLKLARRTSVHRTKLDIHNVYVSLDARYQTDDLPAKRPRSNHDTSPAPSSLDAWSTTFLRSSRTLLLARRGRRYPQSVVRNHGTISRGSASIPSPFMLRLKARQNRGPMASPRSLFGPMLG